MHNLRSGVFLGMRPQVFIYVYKVICICVNIHPGLKIHLIKQDLYMCKYTPSVFLVMGTHSNAYVTIMADFSPEFNPPFRWRSKHQPKNYCSYQ